MNDSPPLTFSFAPVEQAGVHVQRILNYKERCTIPTRGVEASNGLCYRARFPTTSNVRKVLISQWIESYLLQQFAVPTTPAQVLHVPSDITKNDPELSLLEKAQNDRRQPLLCLASRYSVHPEHIAIFDFLPRPLWGKIANLADFATTFVLDQLLGINRSRRILFIRDWPFHPNLFRAYFVDNGNTFGGSHWKFENSLDFESYCSWHAYSKVAPDQWLAALEFVGSQLLPDCQATLAGLPEAWIDNDERSNLERLFDQLQQRQKTLSEWIQIPSPCLQFPAQQTLHSVSKRSASVIAPSTLSPV